MKRPFASIHALTSFLWRSPKQSGCTIAPAMLADWLDEGGIDGDVAYAEDAEARATLLMVGRERAQDGEREYTVDAFALPTQECPKWLLEALHNVLSGATFGPDLCGDLEREAWMPAAWLAVLCARDPAVMEQLADALLELKREGVELDAGELALCVGAWTKYRISDGEELESAVNGVYTICLRENLGG